MSKKKKTKTFAALLYGTQWMLGVVVALPGSKLRNVSISLHDSAVLPIRGIYRAIEWAVDNPFQLSRNPLVPVTITVHLDACALTDDTWVVTVTREGRDDSLNEFLKS